METITLGIVQQWGAAGVCVAVAILVITDKLIWHKRLTEAKVEWSQRLSTTEVERDHWRDVALRSLGVSEKMTVQGEVTAEVLTRLPDPGSGKSQG